MFVMNVDYFGRDFYFNVLAHEFRHMIEHNQDKGEIDWAAEGAAMLAEDLLGYPGVGLRRANMFLSEPDQQLNRWTDEDAKPHYGQGYLLSRYIFDRLGSELYLQLSSTPETGLGAIDTIAKENDLEISGIDIWLDWLAALAIHDRDNLPDRYAIELDGLDVVAMTGLNDLPVKMEETVSQFAADYYLIEGGQNLAISFEGNSFVPVIGQPAASGDQMWLSDRANFRHMQLTRSFDLRDVESAALEYSVYHDIEAGYDFAYLFVSEDGGQNWLPLLAENMKGLDPEDDPSNSALTDRFYSDQSDGWLEERVDLTPYAGQVIQVKIAYITDLIYTKGGIAFDNISVPEIGFYDDGESLAEGWETQGFERVTASIPQSWHLQLITFPDGNPVVQHLDLSPENTLELKIPASETPGDAILIVSATAPKTLLPAHYKLALSN
jgi:immune inhibitor A